MSTELHANAKSLGLTAVRMNSSRLHISRKSTSDPIDLCLALSLKSSALPVPFEEQPFCITLERGSMFPLANVSHVHARA